VEDRLFVFGTLLQDSHLLGSAGDGRRGSRGEWRIAAEVTDAATGVFAGGGKLLLHARCVVATPAQPSRAVHLAPRTVAASRDHDGLLWQQVLVLRQLGSG
jgi:hypothetical protein